MTSPSISLRTRLTLSHLAVVAVGIVTMLIAGSRLAPGFIDQHMQDMERMAGSMMDGQMTATIEEGVLRGFNQALLVAGVVSAIAALAVSLVAARRLLRPLDSVREATRRLAAGSYTERVPLPGEAELAALAADVNALGVALEATEQRRMQLIDEVAHELRTPLATITGYMEGLIDGVFPATEETFAAAGKEAARLERLADDLSRLSRSEEGPDLKPEVVDLGTLAADVAERLRPQFDDQGVHLDVDVPPSMTVVADPDRMTQVFTNIIGNALSYTGPGGDVRVSGAVSKGAARIAIRDTGRGLSPTQLEAVFDRFYRADRAAPGGTGIGLTIARAIVRGHGGEIEAVSPGLGEGSTFSVVLPLARNAATPQ